MKITERQLMNLIYESIRKEFGNEDVFNDEYENFKDGEEIPDYDYMNGSVGHYAEEHMYPIDEEKLTNMIKESIKKSLLNERNRTPYWEANTEKEHRSYTIPIPDELKTEDDMSDEIEINVEIEFVPGEGHSYDYDCPPEYDEPTIISIEPYFIEAFSEEQEAYAEKWIKENEWMIKNDL